MDAISGAVRDAAVVMATVADPRASLISAAMINGIRIAGIGRLSPYFIAAAVAMFAFATIIGWFYCGECAVTYLFGDSGIPFYKFIFTAFIVVGAVSKLEAVWMVSDIFNGLMAIPNLTGLIILRKEVKSV